ncbi:hypothetical protein MUK42_10643 [Musa troglodytarum]|uniref:Uncharacterized protein n=1 Tax=Musa troglodytarum TaxID=320322 RepID=A0A9E7JV49_9LILI|nr:hypothetical protein MUK42_10643 [Musa troglodytarum]
MFDGSGKAMPMLEGRSKKLPSRGCLAFANEFWSFEVAELKARVFLSVHSADHVVTLESGIRYCIFWIQTQHKQRRTSVTSRTHLTLASPPGTMDYVWSPWISMRILRVTRPTILWEEVMANWWSRNTSGVDGHTTYDPAGQFMHK